MPKQGNFFKQRLLSLISAGLVAALLLASWPLPVRAQANLHLTLSNPDTSAYPIVSLTFWPMDDEGNFVANLTADQVHVLENDREVKVTSVDVLEPGIHFVVAVNEGKTLANSYAGTSRLERMKAVITDWIQSESITTLDDFSLVNNTDVLQNQLSHPADWAAALGDYNPDLRSSTPSLNCLSQAVALVKSFSASDNKARAVLYITPLPDSAQLTALQDQANELATANTRLFIWLVGPSTYSSEAGAQALEQAALSIGGSFMIFSGAETLPDLNTYLSPLSHEYKLTYQTSMRKSGTYTLQLKVEQGDFQADSDKISFDLKAEAPNPILLSPPTEIHAAWTKDSLQKWTLTPNLYTFKYLVEFPDGHKRDLGAARLFVDGQLVDEVTTAPFDELKWNFSQYSESGTHQIQIFVEDVAGFTSHTLQIPVLLAIDPKPQTALQKFLEQINYTTVGIVALLVLLGGFLVLFFRRRFLRRREDSRAIRASDNDPVHQRVLPETDEFVASSLQEPPADWPKLPNGTKAPARLLLLSSDPQPKAGSNIPLSAQETLLGSNPVRCDIVLSGVTVSAQHARIFTDAARHFFLADSGSSAGTWLNYAPVSHQGARLQHGDLINVGAVSFRFEEINPEGRPIKVMRLKDEE
jgi:hypothetical protein